MTTLKTAVDQTIYLWTVSNLSMPSVQCPVSDKIPAAVGHDDRALQEYHFEAQDLYW